MKTNRSHSKFSTRLEQISQLLPYFFSSKKPKIRPLYFKPIFSYLHILLYNKNAIVIQYNCTLWSDLPLYLHATLYRALIDKDSSFLDPLHPRRPVRVPLSAIFSPPTHPAFRFYFYSFRFFSYRFSPRPTIVSQRDRVNAQRGANFFLGRPCCFFSASWLLFFWSTSTSSPIHDLG